MVGWLAIKEERKEQVSIFIVDDDDDQCMFMQIATQLESRHGNSRKSLGTRRNI